MGCVSFSRCLNKSEKKISSLFIFRLTLKKERDINCHYIYLIHNPDKHHK